jgi:transcriptional regulator with XRE-family HTH domain
MNMGERIKELRISKGYTQEELGKKLGLKKAAIQKYENGDVENIKRSKIKLLADALGVTPSYIMGWEDLGTTLKYQPKEELTKDEQYLVKSYRKLSHDDQVRVIERIDTTLELSATKEEYKGKVKRA